VKDADQIRDTTLDGQATHQRRGAAHRGEHRQAAGVVEPPSDLGSPVRLDSLDSSSY
jgi:hypothetical protein